METNPIISNSDGFFYIKSGELKTKEINDLRASLSNIYPKTDSKFKLSPISIWEEVEGYVKLPRQLGIKMYPNTKIKIKELKTIESWPEKIPDLYSYQEEALTLFEKLYEENKLGGIIKFGCGRGKTRTAFACANKIKKKTLYICNNDGVCTNSAADLEFTYGKDCPKYSILSHEQSKKRKEILSNPEIPIIFCCYKTIIYPNNFIPADFHCIDLVILDEVHEYLTEISLKLFNFISRIFILGLSATPTKPNGLHFLLDYFVGKIFIDCDNLYKGALPIVKKIYFDVKHIDIQKKDTFLEVRNKILLDSQRSELIANLVVSLAKNEENKILVLGILREQLETYQKLIEEKIPDSTVIYYNVNDKKERDKNLRIKKIILSIIQMGAQSLNIPDLNVMILANKYIPKNGGENTEKINQLCGRVLRKNHEKSPIIYDIVDKHFFFLKHDKLCTKFYEDSGFKVEKTEDVEEVEEVEELVEKIDIDNEY